VAATLGDEEIDHGFGPDRFATTGAAA